MATGTARQLITAANWNWRYYIAAYGRVPSASDVEFYGSEHFCEDWKIPARSHGSYDIGYLEVYGDEDAIARNEWDGGERTLCAVCAEAEPLPENGPEHGYYPMLEINGEIHNGSAVIRCENCDEVIQDGYVIQTISFNGEDVDTSDEITEYTAEAVARAEAEAASLRSDEDAAPDWYVIVLDRERAIDAEEISGGAGDEENAERVIFADGATAEVVARAIAEYADGRADYLRDREAEAVQL